MYCCIIEKYKAKGVHKNGKNVASKSEFFALPCVRKEIFALIFYIFRKSIIQITHGKNHKFYAPNH